MARLHLPALALTTAALFPIAMAFSEKEKRTESFDTTDLHRKVHGVIMSICFLILFPCFAMTLYLVPYSRTASRIHGPLQIFTLSLVIVGLGLGVDVEINFYLTDQHHPKIGCAVVAYLIVVQPLMGFLQHRYFKKHSRTSLFGLVHRWLGRAVILLGMINGGLGLQLARAEEGPSGAPRGLEIAYGVVAGVICLFWLATITVKKVFLKDRKADQETTNATGAMHI